MRFPFPLQYFINFCYVKLMGVDLSEFDTVGSYKSLNELFTRKLKKRREFSKESSTYISPSDSLVTECGDIFVSTSMQIKGFYYKINELLTSNFDEQNIKKVYNGKFINFYLSPRDYHRYHSPINMYIKKAVHVPGLLYPVNLKYLNKVFDLFVKNERVILECETKNGTLFYMVFVGALNVGKMRFDFDDRIQTNSKKSGITTYIYGDTFIKKGEELGTFEMGSTIVMLFEKNSADLSVHRMQKVKFSQTIAFLKD